MIGKVILKAKKEGIKVRTALKDVDGFDKYMLVEALMRSIDFTFEEFAFIYHIVTGGEDSESGCIGDQDVQDV